MSTVVTRFAPSPTGLKHAGNYRTAVFCYLFAKKHKGKFLVRIEDTDQAREKEGSEAIIFETLSWLGVTPDEEPIHSSDRIERHVELLKKIVAEDKAYISHEPKKDDPSRMVDVVRLRNPNAPITFHDDLLGNITFDTTEHGDFVIARAIDDPLYHFAVVVDDGDSGITHIIRGADHISNTPRHILIQKALGLSQPSYTHLPLLLGSDRSKLATRNGAKPLLAYRDEGVLAEAMLNYLAFLGWNPGDEREYLTKDELIEAFDLGRVQKGNAIFDEVKLRSVNQHWMRTLPDADFIKHLGKEVSSSIVTLLKERAKTFGEARAMLEGELACLLAKPEPSKEGLKAKEGEGLPSALSALKALLEPVNGLPSGVSSQTVKDTLMPLADAEEAKGKGGRGAVLWPLRYALSGQERSPDPFTLVSILGPEESASRIQKAIAILEG